MCSTFKWSNYQGVKYAWETFDFDNVTHEEKTFICEAFRLPWRRIVQVAAAARDGDSYKFKALITQIVQRIESYRLYHNKQQERAND